MHPDLQTYIIVFIIVLIGTFVFAPEDSTNTEDILNKENDIVSDNIPHLTNINNPFITIITMIAVCYFVYKFF